MSFIKCIYIVFTLKISCTIFKKILLSSKPNNRPTTISFIHFVEILKTKNLEKYIVCLVYGLDQKHRTVSMFSSDSSEFTLLHSQKLLVD